MQCKKQLELICLGGYSMPLSRLLEYYLLISSNTVFDDQSLTSITLTISILMFCMRG